MRTFLLAIVLTFMVAGCAGGSGNPAIPQDAGLPGINNASNISDDGPHMLWWEGNWYVSATHDKIDVVPKREARLHLNALKFLEQYCTNCLKITEIKNNGDGTTDITVAITHPFAGHPEYTGFDVKGIVMFQGSHEIGNHFNLPLYPESFRLSWRLMGDPEILNADGFTYRWSPWYDSGSSLPIYKYWPGRHSSGTPTANVNGFLNFYSIENRHMFEVGQTVSRTYHIWLPPGPLTIGYAVEACWEPPTITPVTDPVNDFPFSANQPEAYHFKIVFNDGNPITGLCCNQGIPTVHEARFECNLWYRLPDTYALPYVGYWNETFTNWEPGGAGYLCDALPDHPDWGCLGGESLGPNGEYQIFGYGFLSTGEVDPLGYYKAQYLAMDVTDIVIN